MIVTMEGIIVTCLPLSAATLFRAKLVCKNMHGAHCPMLLVA